MASTGGDMRVYQLSSVGLDGASHFSFGLVASFSALRISHHILVGLSLPMVRGGEGTKPQ